MEIKTEKKLNERVELVKEENVNSYLKRNKNQNSISEQTIITYFNIYKPNIIFFFYI